ncbi:methionyl-tRNA synthetase, partial [Phyllosticta citrichinensis]
MRSLFSSATRRRALNDRSAWVWKQCRLRSQLRRSFATATAVSDEKKYFITTPIFYVNAAPHVGHLYTMVLADILKRWQVLRGKNALLCTGTDEHGLKVQQAATKAGMPGQLFCDKGAEVFKNLAARGHIFNDYFVRTTDQQHKDGVKFAWEVLEKRGYIYLSKHEGWYSVSDETFYPASQVHLIIDPATGKKVMASKETGKEVEWTTETNYHFQLSAFRERLLEFYRENPDWIVPRFRMDEVVQSVTEGLSDLSISRPGSRLKWAIPVPTDDQQRIYVWLDALLNYATTIGFPWAPDPETANATPVEQGQGDASSSTEVAEGTIKTQNEDEVARANASANLMGLYRGSSEMTSSGWPPDCHVIGKDIMRFHCVYWPAFCMALGLPLPRRILATSHWIMGKQKMSKSLGNVVNPFSVLERFGPDAMRFYLAHDGGINNDSNYSNHYVIAHYRKSLQNGMGNLAQRITRGRGFDLRRAVVSSEQNKPKEKSRENQQAARRHWKMLESVANDVDAKMQQFDVSGALRTTMEAIYETNRYLQEAAPWTFVIKEKPLVDSVIKMPEVTIVKDRNLPHVDRTIYNCAETLRITGILLQPYMPAKMKTLLDLLGVAEDRRTLKDARPGADKDYGVPKMDPLKVMLFPKIVET